MCEYNESVADLPDFNNVVPGSLKRDLCVLVQEVVEHVVDSIELVPKCQVTNEVVALCCCLHVFK